MALDNDLLFMEQALKLATKSAANGEVPVGSVLVADGVIIAQSGNAPISLVDPTAHAEINTIREGASFSGNYRLVGTTLYSTLEPCVMCAGAIMHARIGRLVFGAYDKKSGACGSIVNLFENHQLNHHTSVVGGLMEDECAAVLKSFFQKRR
ncbi:tRNA adenosine(34) deaminase TadA [Burkholderiales bacterium]|nr:tRNA adenosine(34) deaminase TadA [Burkholderiales bacterium]